MRDGRAENRDDVIDSLIAMFDDGVYQPTIDEVAAHAGVSTETLFSWFADIEDLTRAAIDRTLSIAVTLVDPGVQPDAPTAEKIDGMIASRMRVFDTVSPVARAARALGYRNKTVAAQTEDTRAFLRGQLSRLFAAELEHNPDALPVIDVLCSFEAYDLLSNAQGLSRAKATAVLTDALTKLLSP